jgi:heptosyltransferase-3
MKQPPTVCSATLTIDRQTRLQSRPIPPDRLAVMPERSDPGRAMMNPAMPRPVKAKRRILIYRLGSLGDTVVALPCFHKIAQTWPDAERVVLTNVPVSAQAAPLEAILGRGDLIHGTIAYPVGLRSVGRLLQLRHQIRTLEADVLVYLTPPRGLFTAFRDWLFFKCCGFKTILGVPLSGDLQRCRSRLGGDGRSYVQERESERLARCLSALGPIDLSDESMWDLRLTPRELGAGDAVLGPVASVRHLAISMGGKSSEKDWGASNWQSLAARLTNQYPDAGLVMVGAAEDFQRAQQISHLWAGPVVNTCGLLSPRESAAAMRRAAVFIGHDSGPLHLAAASGVTCVGIFGSFNQPKRWHPHGERHRIIHHLNGIDSITVPEVMKSIREVLMPGQNQTSSGRAEVPLLRDAYA